MADQKPTIDERLEALAQTVEIMAAEGRRLQVLSDRNERRWEYQHATNRIVGESIDDLRIEMSRRETRQNAIERERVIDNRVEKLLGAIAELLKRQGGKEEEQ
jgi:hypothetical protein